MNVVICRSVASVDESGCQLAVAAVEASDGRCHGDDVKPPQDVPPLTADRGRRCQCDVNHSPEVPLLSPNHGGRCQSDVDHSPEVSPHSACDDVICVSKEEPDLENNNEKSTKESCGESPSATITACDDNFSNVEISTKSFDRMTIQHPV